MKRKEARESHTLAPLLVELDDLVDEFDAGETASLRLANDLRVVTLLFSKEIDVQHFLIERNPRWSDRVVAMKESGRQQR